MIKEKYTISLILFLIVLNSCSYQKKLKNLNTINLPIEVVDTIEKRIVNDDVPSIAIAIIDSMGVHYFNFGKTGINDEKVDEHSIYEIGSISKVFTGIMLAQQILNGNLKIDTKINDLLPDTINVASVGDNEMTLGNLTDHTSGFPRMPDNFTPINPNNPFADYTIELMYEFITNYQPVREAGSKYEYSNLAQGLLGHLLAMKMNTTYEKLLVKSIAGPLKMSDTRIEFTKKMKGNLALGHSNGKVVENWDIPTLAGAGAIRSSTTDMARFISANLGYVNTPTMEAMKLSHKIRHTKAGVFSVAMAWHIKKGENGNVIFHTGMTGGYASFAGFVKETGKGVVILSNSQLSVDDIGFNLLDPGSKLTITKNKNEAMDLPESSLDKFIGKYELQPEFYISITKEGTQLYGQATGQTRFEMFAENENLFFLTIVKAKISFQIKNDSVKGLILYQDGQKLIGKKIE